MHPKRLPVTVTSRVIALVGTLHRSPLPSKARSRPDRARFCRRRRPLGSGLGPRHSRTDAKPHRRRKSECVHSEHPNTWRVSLPCGVRSSCKTDATEAGARALVTPGAESRPLGTHGWRGDANSTGKTARPGAGPSRGAVQNTHVSGLCFLATDPGRPGAGGRRQWTARPCGQLSSLQTWSQRPTRSFTGAFQRCAQRDPGKQRLCDTRLHGTCVPFPANSVAGWRTAGFSKKAPH